jgi:hypothetical protein
MNIEEVSNKLESNSIATIFLFVFCNFPSPLYFQQKCKQMGKTRMSALLPANIYKACVKSFFGSKFYARKQLVKPEKESCNLEKQNLPQNLTESFNFKGIKLLYNYFLQVKPCGNRGSNGTLMKDTTEFLLSHFRTS